MPWITIQPEDAQGKFAAAELAAIQSVQLSQDQSDPVATEIVNVVDEVRGYCAVRNVLGPENTIPSKLKDATLSILAYRIASRLPVKSLLTDARTKNYDDAIRLCERVAQGLFRIELATVQDTENSGMPAPSFSGRRPKFSRRWQQDGV